MMSSKLMEVIFRRCPRGSRLLMRTKHLFLREESSWGRMQKPLMTPVSSTTSMTGWMGEKAMWTILLGRTNTPSRANFYRFQIFTTPSSLPVARVQYLADAYAQVSQKCVSLISLMISNSLSELRSQTMMRPSRVQTMSRLCSLRKMMRTMALFQYWLSSPGSTSCRNSPVSLQYSRTKPAASPTKNFLLLQPNSQAVMLVSQLVSLSLVKTFSRVPVMQLQTLTSLEVKRKMLLVREQILKSKMTWNSLISLDFFSREGALNCVIFFSQTRHSESSGMSSSLEGLMKFFSQLMIWMVWKRRKSQMRMFSLSSKDSTQGKDRRNFAEIRFPPCSLYFPVKPLTRETSREQMQMEEQKPQERMQLPNSRVQSIPRTPFLYLELMAELVCSPTCYKVVVFLRQSEQYLTFPSMEAVTMQSGSQISQTSVINASCCLKTETTAKSMAVLERQEAVQSLSSPCLERKAQYPCRGRNSTLWQFPIRLTSHQLQVFTFPRTFRLQNLALASQIAQKTMLFLSNEKSTIKECCDSPLSSKQSTSANLASKMRSKLDPASRRQYFCSLGMYMIFLMQLLVPVSMTFMILYSLLILEQAEEMTQFSWKTLFLQLGLSMRRMFSMIYSVNSDHSRCPSPLMSMAWKNLMRSETKQYLLISFSGEQSFFMRQRKVGSSRPLGQSSNSCSRIYMFYWESIDMMRSMCYLLLRYFSKM